MRCILCDALTRAPGAIVVTGNVEDPDAAPLCRACAALPVSEQKHLRDVAMTRIMVRAAVKSEVPDSC